MKNLYILAFASIFAMQYLQAQSSFNFEVQLSPLNITNVPGIHSYAFAQANGKWLIIGGRRDGLHARQPFNAFPGADNNSDIFVIDIQNNAMWSASVNSLPTSIKEQVQSSNMSYYQDNDTLFLVGGYAYAASVDDHITFPYLTSVSVSQLMNDIINNAPNLSLNFKQIMNDTFAVGGGQMAKIGNTFYLVGGHRFDGRYNPMGHATYVQTYTNQIRKFNIDNSGAGIAVSNISAITDPVHLHRRDYNLVPYINQNGDEELIISSGVFQINADLPFLYPVEIGQNDYTPIPDFNQYLSNYHCATATIYDAENGETNSLFFGGMSRYYYNNGTLIEDNNVPFVKTISRLSRSGSGAYSEFVLPNEMPDFQGASAEFILNHNIPSTQNEIIKISEIDEDTILIGHILGGITSTALHPFDNNETELTSADNRIYALRLIRKQQTQNVEVNGKNPYSFSVSPNPSNDYFTVTFNLDKVVDVDYFVTDIKGNMIKQGQLDIGQTGVLEHKIRLDNLKSMSKTTLLLTYVFDKKYFVTKKLLID